MQPTEHQQTQNSEEESSPERLPEETQRLLGNEAIAKEKALNHDRDVADPDDGLLHLHGDNDEAGNIEGNRSMRSSEYARIAMERQQQFNANRRNNNRDGIRANLRERDQFHDQARGGNVNGAPPPAAAGVGVPP